MRILITGAGGYIGSMLVPYLLAEGHEVIAVDNFLFNSQHVFYSWLSHQDFQLHNQDVRETSYMAKLYSLVDLIIPLAAIVGAPACDKYRHEAQEINVDVIRHMMKHVSREQRILFPNTNSGYGIKGDSECNEMSSLDPISHYGRTKCAAEKIVLDHPNSLVFRLATVCGVSPRMRFDLMFNDFVSKIYYQSRNYTNNFEIFEPEFKRNFVHVRDAVRAFVYMIRRNNIGVYNLGNSSMNMTKMELAENIHLYYGMSLDYIVIGNGEDPDKRNYIVDNSKLMRTGFEFLHGANYTMDELTKLCATHKQSDLKEMRNI